MGNSSGTHNKQSGNTPPKALPEQQGLLYTFVKYCGVSGTQSIIELAIFSFGQMITHSKVANTVAVLCSATFQFLMNRNVTFKSSSNFGRSMVLFVILWIWNYCFSTTMISILPGILGIHVIAVKFFTMLCQGCWGFLLSRYVIFK